MRLTRVQNAIVTACPFCQMNLEVRQAEASRAKGRELAIPGITSWSWWEWPSDES